MLCKNIYAMWKIKYKDELPLMCPVPSVAPLPAGHASQRDQRGWLPVPDLPCCHNSSNRVEGGWTWACRDYVEIGRNHWKWHISARWNERFSELEFLEIFSSFVGRSESSLGSDALDEVWETVTFSWEWMETLTSSVSASASSCCSSSMAVKSECLCPGHGEQITFACHSPKRQCAKMMPWRKRPQEVAHAAVSCLPSENGVKGQK